MDGSMSREGRLQFLVLALLVLLLPFGWYYFFYVSSRQVSLTERNFRLLGVTSQQIQAQIEYLNLAWNQMTEKWSGDIQENYWLTAPDKLNKEVKTHAKKLISLISGLKKDSTKVKLEKAQGAPSPSSFKVERTQDAVNAYFSYSYHIPKDQHNQCENAQCTVQVTAESNLTSLLTPIVNRPEFDDVLVVRPQEGQQDEGEVLFQRSSSGVQILTLSLPVEKNPKGEEIKESQANRLVEIKLAGARYKVFVQPLQSSFDGENKKGRWLVCGLVRADRFLLESLSIPHPVLLGFLFLILTAALTWPFLNLWFIGPRERLSVSDVFFLGLSILVGSALFTLLLLDAYTYLRLTAKLDQQLATFSDNIHGNFREELGKIHQQLTAINNDKFRQINGRQNSSYSDQSTDILSSQLDSVFTYADSTYPYFESVSWIDCGGEQLIKWAVQAQTTPLINVYPREYFRSIREDWTWTREQIGKTFRFYVEPIYSWNTGENLMVYSIPFSSDPILKCPPAAAPDTPDNKQLAVAALDTRPLSLTRPVVPPGFGYAIIRVDGSVLFHLDDTHNLRENLFEETAYNKLLRSAVFGRSAEWIDAEYGGKPHRLYVRPIDDLPWFLVVYRDKEFLMTANLELLSVALLLVLSYFLIFIVFLLVYLWISGDRLRWLWPTPTRTDAYWLLGVTNLVLSLALCGGGNLVTARPESLAVAMVTVLVLEAFFLRRFLIRGLAVPFGFPRVSEILRKRDSFWFRFGYVFALTSIFLPLSVLPTFSFFKVAYEEEMTLVVKHGQLQLVRALEERETRIKAQYFSVKVDKKKEFLDERLKLEPCMGPPAPQRPLDVYTCFFFDTTVGDSDSAPREKKNDENSWGFSEALSKIRPLYGEASIALRGVLDAGSADRLWRWEIGPGRAQLTLWKNRVEKNSSLQLISTMPAFEWPTGRWEWSGVAFGLGLLLVLLYVSVRTIAQRVFLLDFLDPPTNLLVLGPPLSGKSALLQRDDFYVIDFHQRGEQWSETINYEQVTQEAFKVIALDHFEYQIGAPEQDRTKLRLLKELLYTYKKPVVIASTIDLVEFYGGDHAGRNEAVKTAQSHGQGKDSWAGILSFFREVYIGELTQGELNEVIGDQARVYSSQVVWSSCSISEQFLLICVAQNRFVNARNPDFSRLLRRRLIVRDPDLRLMNASFERFVRSITPSREVLSLEETAKTSGWNALKGPLLVVLTGVGLFLYTTQPDLFNATTAFASAAAAGGMPALFKLFASLAQEDKTKQS